MAIGATPLASRVDLEGKRIAHCFQLRGEPLRLGRVAGYLTEHARPALTGVHLKSSDALDQFEHSV